MPNITIFLNQYTPYWKLLEERDFARGGWLEAGLGNRSWEWQWDQLDSQVEIYPMFPFGETSNWRKIIIRFCEVSGQLNVCEPLLSLELKRRSVLSKNIGDRVCRVTCSDGASLICEHWKPREHGHSTGRQKEENTDPNKNLGASVSLRYKQSGGLKWPWSQEEFSSFSKKFIGI